MWFAVHALLGAEAMASKSPQTVRAFQGKQFPVPLAAAKGFSLLGRVPLLFRWFALAPPPRHVLAPPQGACLLAAVPIQARRLHAANEKSTPPRKLFVFAVSFQSRPLPHPLLTKVRVRRDSLLSVHAASKNARISVVAPQ